MVPKLTICRYLIKSGDAQHCRAPEALRDMALACTRSTLSALDFVDPSSSDHDITYGMLNCFYGLHSYASDHWIAHLRRYDEAMPHTDETLATTVDFLCTRHEGIANAFHPERPSYHDMTPRSAFQKLRLSPSAQLFVNAAMCDLLESNSDCSQENLRDQEPSQTLFTLLQEVDQRFTKRLLQLVAAGSEESFPLLDPRLFKSFRKYFADLAYVCRVKGCHQRSKGFVTDKARLEHEQTHETSIKCPHADCVFSSSIGFSSAHALRQHIKKRHNQGDQRLPRFKQPNKPITDDAASFTQSMSQWQLLQRQQQDATLRKQRQQLNENLRKHQQQQQQQLDENPREQPDSVMQLMLLEQQRIKRLSTTTSEKALQTANVTLQIYQRQRMFQEQVERKKLLTTLKMQKAGSLTEKANGPQLGHAQTY